MRTHRHLLATLLITTFMAVPAHAMVEARLSYGLLASKPDLGELYNGSSSLPSVAANYGVGGDVLVFPPLLGWGFGLRQENLGMTASSSGLEFKSTATRTSALLSYRFIDTLLHVGAIMSYGVSHTGGFKVSETSPALNLDWKADSVSSYSIGVDASVGLGLFMLGGEAGYQSMTWKGMTDKTATSSNKPNLDMSGTYLKVFLGIGI